MSPEEEVVLLRAAMRSARDTLIRRDGAQAWQVEALAGEAERILRDQLDAPTTAAPWVIGRERAIVDQEIQHIYEFIEDTAARGPIVQTARGGTFKTTAAESTGSPLTLDVTVSVRRAS